jgi:murein DD-endopeptidase MepM/ murein hydrolase activator NlpD
MYVRQVSQESSWNPDAVSPAGAIGLAQIIPRFHPTVDPRDPVASLDYAAAWLSRLYRQYGSWRKALMAFNWGPGNLQNWNGHPSSLPAETRQYLDVILGPGWPEPSTEAAVADTVYVFPVQDYPKGKIPLHWGTSPNAADLFAKAGTPVRAMVDGTIDDAGWDETGGWYVYLIGDPKTKSLHYYMAHLRERPAVVAGQRVTAGTYLGGVGDTGNAVGTGTHLHIGIGKAIKNGSGPEGGAGVPWPPNNCNKYLQHILDVVGSAPVAPSQPQPAPPIVGDKDARIRELETTLAEVTRGGVRQALESMHDKPLDEVQRELENVVNRLETIAREARV